MRSAGSPLPARRHSPGRPFSKWVDACVAASPRRSRTRGVRRTRSCIVRSIGPPAAPAARSSPPPSSSGTRSSPVRARRRSVRGTRAPHRRTSLPPAARACSARSRTRRRCWWCPLPRLRPRPRPTGRAAVRRGREGGRARRVAVRCVAARTHPCSGRSRAPGACPARRLPDAVGPAGASAAGRRRALGDGARCRRGRHRGGRARPDHARDHRVAGAGGEHGPRARGAARCGAGRAGRAARPAHDADQGPGQRRRRADAGRADAAGQAGDAVVHDRRQHDRALLARRDAQGRDDHRAGQAG